MSLPAGQLVFVAGSLALLAFLSWAAYQSGKLLRENPPDINLLLAPSENAARLVVLTICAGLGLASGLDLGRLGWVVPDPLGSLLRGAALGVAVQLPLNALTRLAIRVLGKDIYSPVVVRMILPKNRNEALLVAVAFVPSVVMEELLFRSLLVGGFSLYLNPWVLGILWSMVFGAMHLPQGSFAMIATSMIGFVLAGAFILSGTLLVPIATHYVINLLQLLDAHRHRDWLAQY